MQRLPLRNLPGTILLISMNAVLLCAGSLPASHLDLKEPVSYAQMQVVLGEAAQTDFITVTTEGHTAQGRELFLVHLYRGGGPAQWRVFLFAQQHGNEPAGKDALLYLIRQIAAEPQILPTEVELWVLPMVNPDGAEADTRFNSSGADLNRDHQILRQTEIQTLHRLHRAIQPHLAVDCHEFTRDSEDYTRRGWIEWAQIMMDCANNPIHDRELYEAGVRWCTEAREVMAAAEHNYARYTVGAAPPEGEIRFSTTEVDDARNGLGLYGGLAFIIESGVFRHTADPHADLSRRVDAYLELFKFLLQHDRHRSTDLRIIRHNRQAAVPPFIPTNYFWGNQGFKITAVPVIERSSGNTLMIPTANFVQDLVVKTCVPTPRAYLVAAGQAEVFAGYLDRQALGYRRLLTEQEFRVEPCRLLRFEENRDPVYRRYENRQIVERQAAVNRKFPAGSLLVPLDQTGGKRAAVQLEPAMLYGLYQYPEFRELVAPDSLLPVFRVLDPL